MIRRLLWPVFVALTIQALRGIPCLGSFSVVWRIRHIEGSPGWGLLCSSVPQVCDGSDSLLFQPLMLVGGVRKAMVMAPPPTCDSAALPCFHGCPAFLHRHFPSQSPPSHSLDPSLLSQQQPSLWNCSTIPKLQLLAEHLLGDLLPCLGYR